MNTFTQIELHNPLRRPDWRFRRALFLHRHSRPCSSEDNGVQRAVEFLEATRRSSTNASLDILAALQLRNSSGPLRWQLESRLLAGQHSHAAAKEMGLSEDVIETYEKLFYNVLDRLSIRQYITRQVIRIQDVAVDDVARIWNHLAYHGGVAVLDRTVDHYEESGRPNYSHLANLKAIAEATCPLERLIGTMLLPMNRENAQGLFELHASVVSHQRRTQDLESETSLSSLVEAAVERATDLERGLDQQSTAKGSAMPASAVA